jgi:hypothetical protein
MSRIEETVRLEGFSFVGFRCVIYLLWVWHVWVANERCCICMQISGSSG